MPTSPLAAWMTGAAARLLAAALAAVPIAGCSFEGFVYTNERYGTVKGITMTLRCRDTYEVFDRPESASLLVVSNVLNEVLVSCIDGGPPMQVRQREVAQQFLAEKTNRPLCRIVGDTELSVGHREFNYRCPVDPVGSRLQRGRSVPATDG